MERDSIQERRRANLQRWVGTFATIAEAARDLGMSYSQLRETLNGEKSFGEKVARRIEACKGWKPGFLDQPVKCVQEQSLAPGSADWHPLPFTREDLLALPIAKRERYITLIYGLFIGMKGDALDHIPAKKKLSKTLTEAEINEALDAQKRLRDSK